MKIIITIDLEQEPEDVRIQYNIEETKDYPGPFIRAKYACPNCHFYEPAELIDTHIKCRECKKIYDTQNPYAV